MLSQRFSLNCIRDWLLNKSEIYISRVFDIFMEKLRRKNLENSKELILMVQSSAIETKKIIDKALKESVIGEIPKSDLIKIVYSVENIERFCREVKRNIKNLY